MSKLRQVLKLHSKGIGKRRIGSDLCMSKNTVKHYIDVFYRMRYTLDELLKLNDYELSKLFHPPQQISVNPRTQQVYDFFPELERQLRKRGVTIAMVYKKFKEQHPEAYGESAFYYHYNQWKKRVSPSMHIEHKAGDKAYVDFAGATLPYVDADTGEIKEAQVFVAILGWSQYSYVEAVPNQTIEEFIAACENALHFFGGCPLGLVPDNLKSAVFKASKYEPILNENYKAFADHYGTAVLPTRSRKPKDKAHVENMVKLAYQNIYAPMPEKQLLPLKELNEAIMQHLKVFLKAPLTGKDCSREDQWKLEKNTLQALPETRYELRTIKQVTVMKNGHIYLTEDQHYYSVPYELIGKKLILQYSRTQVELFYKYELIAGHKRVRSPHNYSTVPDHMPPQHRFVTEWSPAYFMDKAKEIDEAVEYYIGQVLAKKQHPEQAYKSCQGILSFSRRVGNARLIKACKRAHEIGYYNYNIIDNILRNNLDRHEDDPAEKLLMPVHENIRGGQYYQ